jgi:hypothetical protein
MSKEIYLLTGHVPTVLIAYTKLVSNVIHVAQLLFDKREQFPPTHSRC